MAENKGPGRLHAYLASYSGSEEPLMRLLPARPYIELSSNAKMLVEGVSGFWNMSGSAPAHGWEMGAAHHRQQAWHIGQHEGSVRLWITGVSLRWNI